MAKPTKNEEKTSIRDTVCVIGAIVLLICYLGIGVCMFINHAKSSSFDSYQYEIEHTYESSDFDVNRYSVDGSTVYYVLTDSKGESITVTSTPTISERNYIKFYIPPNDDVLLEAMFETYKDLGGKGSNIVVKEFFIDYETAEKIGASNKDIALSNNSNDATVIALWLYTFSQLLRCL